MRFKIYFCCIFAYCLNTSWCHMTTKMSKQSIVFHYMSNGFGNTSTFFDITTYITNSGKTMLKDVEDKAIKQLGILTKSMALQDNYDQYVAAITSYTYLTGNQIIRDELEREFYILDFAETAHDILTQQAYMLIQELASSLNYENIKYFNDNIKSLSEYVDKATMDVKKDNFAYICKKVDICRRTPAYSDYLADVLQEMLLLPEDKFQDVAKILNLAMELKATSIQSFLDDNVSKVIGFLCSSHDDDIVKNHKHIVTVKNILKKKYKIFRSKTGEINIKKKAMRILIDILDKSFEMLKDESVRVEVDELISKIRVWKKNDDFDIQKVIVDYIGDVGKTLEFILQDNALKNEIRVLIEYMVTGKSKYFIDSDLFIKGSEFVRRGKPNIGILVM